MATIEEIRKRVSTIQASEIEKAGNALSEEYHVELDGATRTSLAMLLVKIAWMARFTDDPTGEQRGMFDEAQRLASNVNSQIPDWTKLT